MFSPPDGVHHGAEQDEHPTHLLNSSNHSNALAATHQDPRADATPDNHGVAEVRPEVHATLVDQPEIPVSQTQPEASSTQAAEPQHQIDQTVSIQEQQHDSELFQQLQSKSDQDDCQDRGRRSPRSRSRSPPSIEPQMIAPTNVAPEIVPDFDIDDEGYAESTTTSYVTSIASEVSKGILENDRIYPSYGKHNYGMPVDEEEMDRMDLQHRKYELCLGDRHFLAPIGDSPQKILDLGTGTGIWALDIADLFPSASVTGVDIAPIQPKWVAPNCQFEIEDVEANWTWKPNSFDFIHLRDPLYMIHDWPRFLQQVYDHLRPGGYFEIACIHPQPLSDDGSMPTDSGFKLICDKLVEASTQFGTPCNLSPQFRGYLLDAGFVDVSENIFKIPSSPWPKDPRLKRIGALEMMNVIAGATAFGLRAFEQVFGWTKIQTELAVIEFKRDVKNRNYHQYCP